MSAKPNSKHEIRAAVAQIRKTRGVITVVAELPPPPRRFTELRTVAVVLLLVAAFCFAAVAMTGCHALEVIGGALQGAGEAVATVPHPLAIPAGVFLGGIGGLLSAVAKYAQKPALVKIGLGALALGAAETGTEVAMNPATTATPPAIHGPVEPGAKAVQEVVKPA